MNQELIKINAVIEFIDLIEKLKNNSLKEQYTLFGMMVFHPNESVNSDMLHYRQLLAMRRDQLEEKA